MTTLYHTLFVDRMYSLEHNNMTAAPVIKGNTSGFLPTGASLSISKWRLREIGVYRWKKGDLSLTRPPDLCAIPVISLAAVPQQQRDREIIGADTLLGACPAGAQCIAADAGSDGKGRR